MYEGQCYSCKFDQVPWHSARSSCSQLGAHLVTISNSGIQTFLQSMTFLLLLCSNLVQSFIRKILLSLFLQLQEIKVVWDTLHIVTSFLSS